MRKRTISFFLALLTLCSLLTGCVSGNAELNGSTGSDVAAATTEPTVPATIPADGDPDNVTCKGSYTADSADPATAVATAGSHTLTVQQLQVWYWLQVAQYAQGSHDAAPDFSRPLDSQVCPIDDSVNSWQQYFLKQALNSWHSACALELQSRELPLVLEEAYQPNMENQEKYMTGMPATEVLYGYNRMFEPNSMHEAYLTALPETLDALAQQKGFSSRKDMAESAFGVSDEVLAEVVRMYNYSYTYFTQLGYAVDCPQETVLAYMDAEGGYDQEGYTVDFRHILLIPEVPVEPPLPEWKLKTMEPTEPKPKETVVVEKDGSVTCSEELWTACMERAETMLADWKKDRRCSGYTFSELAVKHSADVGSALNGGIYRQVEKGQMMDEIDTWCFDPARQSGDTYIFRSRYGCHMLYFTGKTEKAFTQAKADLTALEMSALVETARTQYPAKINYSAISLLSGESTVSASDILYPDIAHERFPEVPLYLQQDYPTTRYGAFPIRSHGCGITTMAMLASYMADDELTPPEMCARYGNYSHSNGTDGMIFQYEPSVMGFYLREVNYDHRFAKAALEEGQIVISVQHKGYWTRGGHYIVLEKMRDDGQIQVRDSNIFNYSRVVSHKEDRHTWGSITANGAGFWIFEDKITRIPACSRCGTPEEMIDEILHSEYICEKCDPALLRRNTYLSTCNMDA